MGEIRASDFPSSAWRKSAASQANGACVEVASVGTKIATRDSKRGNDSPILQFTSGEWKSFVESVKTGKFDLA